MAVFSATTSDLGGLSDQIGVGSARLFPAGLSASYGDSPARWVDVRLSLDDAAAFDPAGFGLAAARVTGNRVASFATVRGGSISNLGNSCANWFEDVHVIPRSLELGNIISDQQFTFEVFNGYRYDDKVFNSLALNAGAGITTSGLASLPATLQELDTSSFTLLVSSDGDSTISGTLDFVVSGVSISVPVTGSRVVMFPYPPQSGYTEELEFLTDVIEKMDGREQRIALRDRPRISYDFTVRVPDGVERQRVSNLLFDWQSQLFGVPVWHEPSYLTADAATGSTAVTVGSTAFADFKVGDLAIIRKDDVTFDALTVSSTTATTVEFSSPTNFDYEAGDEVMPVKLSYAQPTVSRSRPPVGSEDFRILFKVVDSGSDLSDTSPYNTYNSKVLLNDPNFMSGTSKSESLRRKISVLDSTTGRFTQSSAWDRGKKFSSKGFLSKSRQELWNIRGLVHGLRGQQISFYIPSFFEDVVPTQDLASGGSTMEIQNGGYTRFVNARTPNDAVQVTLTDGSTLLRGISSATEVDSSTEQLTLDSGWPVGGVLLTDILRVDFVQKSRMATDKVKITHKNNAGHADVSFATVTVFE